MSDLQCTVESVGHKFPLQCRWATTACLLGQSTLVGPLLCLYHHLMPGRLISGFQLTLSLHFHQS